MCCWLCPLYQWLCSETPAPLSTAGQPLYPLRGPHFGKGARPLPQGEAPAARGLPLLEESPFVRAPGGEPAIRVKPRWGAKVWPPRTCTNAAPEASPGRAPEEGEGSAATESQERPRDPPPAPSRSRPRPHPPPSTKPPRRQGPGLLRGRLDAAGPGESRSSGPGREGRAPRLALRGAGNRPRRPGPQPFRRRGPTQPASHARGGGLRRGEPGGPVTAGSWAAGAKGVRARGRGGAGDGSTSCRRPCASPARCLKSVPLVSQRPRPRAPS